MRLNGHNDQCACTECGLQPQLVMPSIGIELNEREQAIIDRRFDRSEQGVRVRERRGWMDPGPELPSEVHGAEVVGVVELADVPETGRIAALEVVVHRTAPVAGVEHWAIWWDRTVGQGRMVARKIERSA